MSDIIYTANKDYPFHALSLANPHGIQGGAFFSKLLLEEEFPCLFQTPKCSTKNGIVQTDKKIYCDLMISDDNDTFLNFLQELEKSIQVLIYEKRNMWFHNEMEMENIEYFFNPIIRTYKKQYLVRTYVQQPKHIKNLKSLQIYDENENRLSISEVTKDKKIISIIEGLGIKFTSSSFHIELCLRQLMVLEDKPLFEKCLIQTNRRGLMEPSKPLTKMILNPVPNTDIDKNDNIEDKNINKKPELETSPPLTEENKQTLLVESLIEDQEVGSDDKTYHTSNDKMNLDEDTNLSKEEEKIDNNILDSIGVDSSAVDDIDKNMQPNKKEEDKSIIENNEINREISPKAPPNLHVELDKPLNHNEPNETLEKNIDLCEINLSLPEDGDTVHLKRPIEVYREIYAKALEKAKEARRLAVQAFLEAKKIKNAFLSGEMEDSDDDLDNFQEISN